MEYNINAERYWTNSNSYCLIIIQHHGWFGKSKHIYKLKTILLDHYYYYPYARWAAMTCLVIKFTIHSLKRFYNINIYYIYVFYVCSSTYVPRYMDKELCMDKPTFELLTCINRFYCLDQWFSNWVPRSYKKIK